MNQNQGPPKQQPIPYAAIGKQAFMVGGEVGCVTVLIILGVVLAGLWLDNRLGTKPLLTVLMVIGSAPLSIFLTLKLARRTINPIDGSKVATREPASKEGVLPRE